RGDDAGRQHGRHGAREGVDLRLDAVRVAGGAAVARRLVLGEGCRELVAALLHARGDRRIVQRQALLLRLAVTVEQTETLLPRDLLRGRGTARTGLGFDDPTTHADQHEQRARDSCQCESPVHRTLLPCRPSGRRPWGPLAWFADPGQREKYEKTAGIFVFS